MKPIKTIFHNYPWIISMVLHTGFIALLIFLPMSKGLRLPGRNKPDQIPSYPIEVVTRLESPALPEVKPAFKPVAKEPLKPQPITEPRWDTPAKEPDTLTVTLPRTPMVPDTVYVRRRPDISYDQLKQWQERIKPSLPSVSTLARPTEESLRNKPPEYPEHARQLGQEGLVLLEVVILEDGTVGEVEILASAGYPLLDEAAIRAVRRWYFTPATVNGRSIESRVRIPIRFRLE